MTKHTPGPWIVSTSPDYWEDATVIRARNWYGAVICPVTKTPHMLENAKLISAAPDLLEALRALLQEHQEMNAQLHVAGKGRPSDAAHPDSPADMARVAIAKAEGR